VVDDEPEIREVVADYLELEGYTAVQASGCEAALVVLAGQPVALLLTDIRMPCCTGVQLAEQAGVLYPALPVLLMTGYALNGFPHQTLHKPFRMTDMMATITGLLAAQPAAR